MGSDPENRALAASDQVVQLREAGEFLRRAIGDPCRTAIVLGSGWAEVIGGRPDLKIPYSEIPHFPVPAVAGHTGELSVFSFGSTRFVVLTGRVHLYEGFEVCRVVFAVRTLALWGVLSFVITNSAGAINQRYRRGDLMLIRDHINLLGANPLTGMVLQELGPGFPDMTRAYSPSLLDLARRTGASLQLSLQEGVYAAVPGPSYETPAEIRMLASLGADAVGMSTVPETIALHHLGRRVLAISCISNMAAGLGDAPLSHTAVLESTKAATKALETFLIAVVEQS